MRTLLLLVVLMLGISSCRYLNPNIMLQTDKDYQYSQFKDTVSNKDYKISPNDIIEFKLYSNNGFKIIDLTSITTNQYTREERYFTVEYDGLVKLPILGRVEIAGYTVRQAEMMLEEKYAEFYKDPFVLLEVINKRVIVFPGSPGDAKVLTLENNNTTLIEALAQAGGISETGKAWQVKVIRDYSSTKPEVFLIDLSTIEGIEMARMTLQASDIIYVEPQKRIGREVLREITPVLSLLTSVLVVYGLLIKNT